MTDATDWDVSSRAWIASMGEAGDFGRRYVLDRPMLERIRGRGFRTALDVGCGEGRFCRLMEGERIAAIGVDPTAALIDEARRRDSHSGSGGDYRIGRAEALDFPDNVFDLVVSYLVLIDVERVGEAIGEMARVLRPGGALLVANLNGFATASVDQGWRTEPGRGRVFAIDHYLDERCAEIRWRGIAVRNWHRPLETYMRHFLSAGLVLSHFAEPAPYGGPSEKADRYRRVPQFVIMEWRKPDLAPPR